LAFFTNQEELLGEEQHEEEKNVDDKATQSQDLFGHKKATSTQAERFASALLTMASQMIHHCLTLEKLPVSNAC
jgi:hypothetical protein